MDAQALLFSIKCFAAGMLAYYIALRMGLPKPSWAIVTVYIVSQPSAGASVSRGVYRFIGTVVGAVATIVIIPHFAHDPFACGVALACWIGLCLFFSLLDRTPRAYAFVLAGYTTSLIGFPATLDPGMVFNTASVRVQEISIGILCATLMHRFLLPNRVSDQFTGKLSQVLSDTRRLCMDALSGKPRCATCDSHNQLAVELLALRSLMAHLPYDPSLKAFRYGTLHLLHDRLAQLIPVTLYVNERINALKIRKHQNENALSAFVASVESWITAINVNDWEARATQLLGDAQSLRIEAEAQVVTGGNISTDDSFAANLAAHLAVMINLVRDCEQLAKAIHPAKEPPEATWSRNACEAVGYVYHRDFGMAARAGLGATVGIVIGCAIWMGLAWTDGGTAVSILGVCCALFGNADAPASNILKYTIGSVYGVVISLAYSFVVLPQVTEFPVLVAVLFPAFLLAGSMQARPQSTFMALGITLTLPILAGLDIAYKPDFAASLNSIIALFAATGLAMVTMSLFQTIPISAVVDRMFEMSRKDIRDHARGRGCQVSRWTNLMIDRTALLYPRFQQFKLRRNHADEALRYLRIGCAVSKLSQLCEPHSCSESHVMRKMTGLLSTIGAHFSVSAEDDTTAFIDLLRHTENLMRLVAASASPNRRQLLDALIDLRFSFDGKIAGEEPGA